MTEQDKPQMNEREAIVAWLRESSRRYEEKATSPMLRVDGAATELTLRLRDHCSNISFAADLFADRIARGDHLKGQTDDR